MQISQCLHSFHFSLFYFLSFSFGPRCDDHDHDATYKPGLKPGHSRHTYEYNGGLAYGAGLGEGLLREEGHRCSTTTSC